MAEAAAAVPATAATARLSPARPVAAATRLRASPWLAAPVAGAAVTLSLPPVGFLPGLLGFAVLLHLLHGEGRAWRAFAVATLFGLGYSVTGLYWIGIAFFVDARTFGAAAVPAVLGLCTLLAVLKGLGALGVHLLRPRSLEARALLLAPAWALAEMVQEGTFIRFPWNPVSLAWAASNVTLQGVAWFGTYGLTIATVTAAGMAARCLEPGIGARRRWSGLAAPAALLAVLLCLGAYRLAGADPGLTDVRLRLVQAAIPQDLKWDPDKRLGWFRRHLDMSAGPPTLDPPPDVLVWPESAVPFALDREPAGRRYIGDLLAPGAHAVVGGDRYETDAEGRITSASNSLFALDKAGDILARYDKANLVPFGEFVPFRGIAAALGLGKLTQGSFDMAPGPGRTTIALPGLPPFSPTICSEVSFPNTGAPSAGPRPSWILTITNDAWFGNSSGPYQHVGMARMRAVEEGLPLAFAANTGISVVVDAYGRVLQRLGLGEMGVVDARLPAALPEASPERRLGWPLLAGIMLLALGSGAAAEAAARRRGWGGLA